VITECADFPKGAHDDLADALSQAVIHMRKLGLAMLPDEDELDDIEDKKYKKPLAPMYPAYGGADYAPIPLTIPTGVR